MSEVGASRFFFFFLVASTISHTVRLGRCLLRLPAGTEAFLQGCVDSFVTLLPEFKGLQVGLTDVQQGDNEPRSHLFMVNFFLFIL